MQQEAFYTKHLDLSYEDYVKNGKTIIDTRLDKYVIYEKLDKGAFGTVYRGMDDITKREVAVKVIDLAAIQRDQKNPKVRQIRRRLAQSESEMMKMVNSPHIMKLWDVYENQHLKIMVIQFCNGGTLSDMIYRRQRIPQKQAIQILKQVIFGVAEMHRHNIIHRDIKSENIMSHNGVYKIVDLGFAKMLPSNSDIFTGTILGTIITMAPEVMKRKPYGVKADIWSLGIIFYEMIYGVIPFQPMKAPDMYDQIVNKDIFPNGGRVNGYRPSQEVIALMKQILVIDQDYRMSWEQLIDHKIFKVNRQKLPEEFRVTVNLQDLKKNNANISDQKTEEQRIAELPSNQMKWQELEPTKISKLTRKEKDKKMEEIDKTEKKILQHSKEYYLQCLKTQYILKEMIIPIEQQKLFKIDQRSTVELLYLLSSRCYCNMSNVRSNILHEKHEVTKIIMGTVKYLYDIIQEKFNFYCSKLKKIEDRYSSIIGDAIKKVVRGEAQKTKDIFLGGVQVQRDESMIHLKQNQMAGYTKEQQIRYTYDNYILPMLGEKKLKNDLTKKLTAYLKINQISHMDIQNTKFLDKVQKIISQLQ